MHTPLALSCVAISVALAAHAHAQNDLRLVARPVASTPGDPTPLGLTGGFTNLSISPSGRIAFNAQHRVLLPNGSRQVIGGAFVERTTGNTLITAGLINDVQNTPAVYAIDAAGNVLLRGRVGNPTPVDTLAISRATESPLLLTGVGGPIPGIPNATVGTILPISFPPAIQPARILPLNLRFPIPVTLAPGAPVFGAMLAGSDTGVQLLATSTPLATSNPPPTLPIAWPSDVAQSGSFIIEGTTPRVYHNGVIYPLPTINTLIPGGFPGERVTITLNSRIASNGHIIAGYANNQGGAVILMGPPDDLQIVFRSGQVLSSPTATVTPTLEVFNGPLPMSIDDTGVGYVFARQTQLSNPGGAILPFAIIRVERGVPARVAYVSTEPVRARTGELVPPFIASSAGPMQSLAGGGRFAWRMNIDGIRNAICSFTDAGDPYIVFTQGDTAGSPPLMLTPTLPTATNTTISGLFAINARGDAAIISVQGNAIFVSPAPVFTCGDPDFNNDGVYPSDQDMIDFFNVYAGTPCPTLRCDTLDFNRNGTSPEDQDVIDFLTVLAGGSCSG